MLTLSEDNPVYSNLHILELIFIHNFIGVGHVKRLNTRKDCDIRKKSEKLVKVRFSIGSIFQKKV